MAAGSCCEKEWSLCLGGVHFHSSCAPGPDLGWRTAWLKHAENLAVQNANTHGWLASTSKLTHCQLDQSTLRWVTCILSVCAAVKVSHMVALDQHTAYLMRQPDTYGLAAHGVCLCTVHNISADLAQKISQPQVHMTDLTLAICAIFCSAMFWPAHFSWLFFRPCAEPWMFCSPKARPLLTQTS